MAASVGNTGKDTDRISIQVALSGYSFKVSCHGAVVHDSGWFSADRIFVTPEFQKRYDAVEISLFTPKAALFPVPFFSESSARRMLSETVPLEDSDTVESIMLPEFNAVLVYSNSIGETLSKAVASGVLRTDGYKAAVFPELYYMLKSLSSVPEYNKIVASYADRRLYLVIAQGKSLLLCNSFDAMDFTTAQYFIFSAVRKLQMNPEVSTIYFRTPLPEKDEMSLYRYFTSVEIL